MEQKACCFTGHRRISAKVIETLEWDLQKTIEGLIEKGYTTFLVGGALGFDTLAAIVILRLKRENPNVKLVLVLPCLNQTNGWSENDIRIYEKIKEKCDKFIYTSQEYTSDCMFKRNRYLVDNSSICISYCKNTRSGTGYTVRYAKSKGLEVINLAQLKK